MMKHTLLLPVAALALLTCGGASAQCATGVDTGGGGCIPPEALPGAQPNQQQGPPPPQWISKFGALVMDKKTGAIGVADNMDSQEAAFSKASAQCEQFGGQKCDYRLPVANQCVALALGSGVFGVGRNDDEDEAASVAGSQCQAQGNGCKVVYHSCSRAIKLR